MKLLKIRRRSRALTAAAASVAAIALIALPADAAPLSATGTITEYAGLSGQALFVTSARGLVWLDEVGGSNGGALASVTPGGSVHQITGFDDPIAGITGTKDGSVWFGEVGSGGGAVGRLSPNGAVTVYPLVSSVVGSRRVEPVILAAGADGNVWFSGGISSSLESPYIGKITPTGKVTTYNTGVTQGITYITPGPDGNIWFTSTTAQLVGKITPKGQVVKYPVLNLTSSSTGPQIISAGPGGTLWFNIENSATNELGRITTGGAQHLFPTGGTSVPGFVTEGPDGNIWFTTTHAIGRMTPTGTVTFYTNGLPVTPNLQGIGMGPDGNLWFSDSAGNHVGRVEVVVNSAMTTSTHCTIVSGKHNCTASGVLRTVPLHMPYAGATVTLLRQSGSSWVTVATRHSSAAGAVSVTLNGLTTSKAYRWSWAGNSSHTSGMSSIFHMG